MKIKKFFIVLLAILLISSASVCSLVGVAYAAENEESAIEQIEDEAQIETDIGGIADNFINYLKERYGDDYTYYYNRIIEQWGSVEAYLLSFGEKLPEDNRNSWERFVGWLDEYASVWAPALAVAVVIIVALVGKKTFNAIVDKVVNAKLKPIVNELNAQSKATVAILHSQKALLGSSEKFANNVRELEQGEKELTNG